MSEKEKKDILGAEIDEKQMDEVTGGYEPMDACGDARKDERTANGCRKTQSIGCDAVTEDGSWCMSNDRCMIAWNQYGDFPSQI